jgi:hypothetical protein
LEFFGLYDWNKNQVVAMTGEFVTAITWELDHTDPKTAVLGAV